MLIIVNGMHALMFHCVLMWDGDGLYFALKKWPGQDYFTRFAPGLNFAPSTPLDSTLLQVLVGCLS